MTRRIQVVLRIKNQFGVDTSVQMETHILYDFERRGRSTSSSGRPRMNEVEEGVDVKESDCLANVSGRTAQRPQYD